MQPVGVDGGLRASSNGPPLLVAETDTADARARNLRSRAWFDNPDDVDRAAPNLERHFDFGLPLAAFRSGKPIIGIAQTGSDPSPCNRHHLVLAERVRDGIARRAASRSNSPSTPSRRRASARPRASTATSPIWGWSRCGTATRSAAWC